MGQQHSRGRPERAVIRSNAQKGESGGKSPAFVESIKSLENLSRNEYERDKGKEPTTTSPNSGN